MTTKDQLAALIDRPEATEAWLEFERAVRDAAEEIRGPGDGAGLMDDSGGGAQLMGGGADGLMGATGTIPVTGPWVNLHDLHAELRARLERAMADPRISSIARVSSGVRTYQEQVQLFRQFGSGRAANPDYRGPDGRKGSKHMIQDATWRYAPQFAPCSCGYAVDVGFWDESNPPWSMLRATMADHGLRLTVFQPFEPWYFELDPHAAPSPGPANPTVRVSTPPAGSDTVLAVGSQGPAVEQVQLFLGGRNDATPNIVPRVGRADGLYGPATAAAVQGWQRHLGLDADGAYGPETRKHTDAWRHHRSVTIREGARGATVLYVQHYLAERHAELPAELPDPGSADGEFGSTTATAVRAWQGFLHIGADGVWGPGTWGATDTFEDRKAAGRPLDVHE